MKNNVRLLVAGLMTGLVAAVIPLAFTGQAQAALAPVAVVNDVDSPVLQAFDFTPKSVDVTEGPAEVTISARVTDATGAPETVAAEVQHEKTTRGFFYVILEPTGGTATDRTYQGTVTIPQGAPSGNWTVSRGPLQDTLGNTDNTWQAHNEKLWVTAPPSDIDSPVLQAFDFTPKSVDVTEGPAEVTISARVTDATGAPETVAAEVQHEKTTRGFFYVILEPTGGTATDRTYQGTVTIPQGAPSGSWTVSRGPLQDTLGNTDNTWQAHNEKLWVTAPPSDIDSPVLQAFDFTPKSVDVTEGPAEVTISARVTDATGAPETVAAEVQHQRTTEGFFYVILEPTGGTATDRTYQGTVTIPQGAPSGNWTVSRGPLQDTLGNTDNTWQAHDETLWVQPPPTAPAAPSGVSATVGDASATVSWVKPSNGSPVTGYTITRSPGGVTKTVAGDQTTATLTGLDNGTGYSFTVVATNAVGDSPASAASNTVTPAGVPDQPVAPTAVRGDRSATVSWSAASGNGSPITSYTITRSPGGFTKTVAGADTTSTTIGGLTNGTGYSFTVVATSAVGDSPASAASNTVTPAGVPDQPVAPTAVRGDRSATVSWTAASGNGSPITSYTITRSPGGFTKTVAGDQTTATVTGLDNGTGYTFTVMSTNAVGNSAASDPSSPVTPTVPDISAPVLSGFDFTPKSVDLNSGAKQVTVTAHLTDATGATAPTMLISSDATTQSAGFGSMTLVSGTIQDGTWERTVTIPATAAPGAWTVKLYPLDDTLGNDDSTFHSHPTKLAVTNTPPATAPAAPAGVTATPGNASATVSWTKPANGGSAITGYTITSSPGGVTKTVTGADTTSATLTGLTNGNGYTFTVTATNTVGTSTPSTPSNTATPAGVSSQVTVVSATRGDHSAVVAWAVPADDGGAPVTGYTVTSSPGGISKTVTGADTTSTSIGGLTNGTAYTFTVTATNSVGDSPASTASNTVTPAGVPAQAARPTAEVQKQTVTVRWKAARANGSPITGYVVRSTSGSIRRVSAGVRMVRFTNLKPGIYKFTVAARNELGAGPNSTPVRVRIR